MKKKLLFGLCCAALIAGCTTDPYDLGNEVVMEGTPRINISGAISQEYISRVNDGGFCQDDQVGLFGVNYTDNNTLAGELLDEGNQVDNARYTYDEANNQWVASGNIYYKDSKTNIDLYGYYPYGTVNSVSEYAFEVQQDQSGNNSVDGYAQSDFLWGKATNIAPTEQKIKILFNHKMACANVVLVEGENFADGEFASLKKSVLVMNTSRTSTINLATGVVSATGEVESEGIVMKSNEEGYKAIVVPQTVAAGASLFSITVDGVAYRFKKDVDFTYEQGKQAKFTIEVSKKVPSGDYEFSLVDCEIVDWIADIDTHGGEARQYYVVHCEEAGTLEEKILADKKNPAKIKNLKVSGKISAADFTFMRDKMDVLQSINLKEAQIADWIWLWRGSIDGETKDVYFTTEYPNSWDEAIAQVKAKYPNSNIVSSNYYRNESYGKGKDVIPANAFRDKLILVNFVFPEKVTKIGENAFQNCSMLTGALIIPDDVVEIEGNAFGYCKNITSISLPQNLERIGDCAFIACTSISSLNLPSSLKEIGSYAFAAKRGVNSGGEHMQMSGQLILPESLTKIGEGAFQQCSSLQGSITIPPSVTIIENYIFYECYGLNGQLILHDGIKEFRGEYIDGISALYTGAFNNCRFQGELKLPANLLRIPSGYFQNCQFSRIDTLPNGLLDIGSKAFAGNSRLMGTLEFPDELVALGEGAFTDCSNLEGVVLPAELAILKSGVFSGCYYLNKIVCKAIEPPYVQSGAFNGVAKDNFAVEVPEQSVNRYQNSSGWNEFKRIVAHHDFTISRRLMRTLNAEHTREFVLRAPSGFAWSVESMPEWVTVTPSSGVGKTEVTVTVAEMTAAEVGEFEINTGSYNNPRYERNRGRAGEIVFLLDGKDYRATMKVEQYDSDRYDGEVITNQSATKGGGVNLVFMGDCFDACDIAHGSYLDGINEAIGYYFDIEPYKTYRDYFNVYTVVGMSNDSGMGTVNTIRDAKFGSQYSLAGITPNHEITYEYAMKTSIVNKHNLGQTLVVMIENTTEYGGICYMWGDGSAIACCPMSDDAFPYDFRGIVQHEAGGHGFAKLADEYIYTNVFISACSCPNPHLPDFYAGKSLGWFRNIEDTGDMDQVGWSHLIFHPTYSNIVDIYEGGYYHTRGIFRSEPNSCMNNNIPYFSAISRQEAVERIMRYAGEKFDINDFYAKDVLDSQGNNTGATRLSVEENAITLTGAGKQMPPKFMGDKPQLKKSNK